MNITEILTGNPLIAAAKHETLQDAIDSKASAIILMNGKINELMKEEFQICNKKKPILLHTDLIKGLSNDKESINFIKEFINPLGIVSTKSNMIRAAKKKGLVTIQRIFCIDSGSLRTSIESVRENNPDLVEIMPAFVYPIVKTIKNEIDKPIILGGLISTKEQIVDMLNSGSDAISCGNSKLWNIEIKREYKKKENLIFK